ncbi:hypothetical protein KIN20_028227 [Parelaphostrongylus tenuis]|uniref:Uncharacterized protein n=1 Tax=Parelaphostrongylus tenuis TaxID=148309 RepID=A0AAD5R182_PARTN|nr:hypothetical protein KIN20_028227 [Parelaphostrongylus tenuis]
MSELGSSWYYHGNNSTDSSAAPTSNDLQCSMNIVVVEAATPLALDAELSSKDAVSSWIAIILPRRGALQ